MRPAPGAPPPPSCPAPAAPGARWRPAEALLAALAAAMVALTAARLPAAWESGNALNHVSGAWMALADDLAHGTFYRPLHDPALGFGGTRFFPLAFSLHAALVALGAPLLAAGQALSLLAGLLLAASAFRLLRRLGLGRPGAAACAALALGGFAGQHALAAVRGDLLAVALQAAGLAALGPSARGPAPSRRALGGAALAFTLAFAAKPTALTAPAAAVAFLALRHGRRPAVALAARSAAGAAAVVLVTEALSGGRFLALLAACAAGGATPADLLHAPLRLAWLLVAEDRAGLVLLAVAAAALAAAAPRTRAGWRAPEAAGLLLAGLWSAAALAGLLAVMASPGTGANHLLEAEAAGAVALGASAAAPGRRARAARRLAPVAALAGALLAGALWRADRAASRLAELRGVIAAAPAGRILSEDPLVPLLAGERPLLVDAWMLRLAAERDPRLARPLLEALRAGALPAVVLFQDLADPGADAWYARGNLGPGPVAEIRRRYRHAGRWGRYHLYLPARGAGGQAPTAAAAAEPRKAL